MQAGIQSTMDDSPSTSTSTTWSSYYLAVSTLTQQPLHLRVPTPSARQAQEQTLQTPMSLQLTALPLHFSHRSLCLAHLLPIPTPASPSRYIRPLAPCPPPTVTTMTSTSTSTTNTNEAFLYSSTNRDSYNQHGYADTKNRYHSDEMA